MRSSKGSGVLHWVQTLVPGGFDDPHCVHCMDGTALRYCAYHTPATCSFQFSIQAKRPTRAGPPVPTPSISGQRFSREASASVITKAWRPPRPEQRLNQSRSFVDGLAGSATGKTLCWGAGIGMSPLRSLQRNLLSSAVSTPSARLKSRFSPSFHSSVFI